MVLIKITMCIFECLHTRLCTIYMSRLLGGKRSASTLLTLEIQVVVSHIVGAREELTDPTHLELNLLLEFHKLGA